MAIKQVIKYNSDNQYFAGFLQSLIDESEILASVTQDKNEIVLLLDDTDVKKLEEFSNLTTKYLPYSIFLGEIETSQEDLQIKPTKFKSKTYNISLCGQCLEELTNPSSSQYLDDSIKCHHYSNDSHEYYEDYNSFSPHYSDDCTVLVCDISKIDDLFIMTQDEQKVLFSIEKPTIKVTIKDENLRQQCKRNFIDVRLPYNTKSALVATNAKDSEVPYLFFNDTNPSKVVVNQQNVTIIRDSRFATTLDNLDDDKVVNRFLNLAKQTLSTQGTIGANLSTKNGLSFLVQNEVGAKKVLTFQEFDITNILEDMKHDSVRGKLLENFALKYPDIINSLSSRKYDLFEALSVILELEKHSYEAFSEKSLEFRGNGGLKIDINFNDDGCDYVAFLGSVMSFKLAGVDTHYLAYSIFEALADMTISVLNQLSTKFKIKNFVMMGDMFENSVLYSRIKSKFQLSNPFFSKNIAFDE